MKPVITFGETMGLFRASSSGSLAHVSDFHFGIGGAESNVAIALARLGAPARWFGRVGADPIGRRILRELRAESVDVRAVVDECAATGIMLKEQRTRHATRVHYYRSGSAGSRLSPDDIPSAGIGEGSILHITGITPALSGQAHEAVISALDTAEHEKVPVSFDVNHRNSLWRGRDPAPTYRSIAARSDVVFAGEDEARILVPHADSPLEQARAIADLGPADVVIKRGAAGCAAVIDGLELVRAAVPVLAVDSVGAGDAFVGAYLAELVAGRLPEDRLRTAVRVGAFACLNPGDWEGFPTREELGLLDREEPVER